MKIFNTHKLGVAQGEAVLFSDFQHNGEMWSGKGQRTHKEDVIFPEAFDDVPMVQVGFSMWDFDSKTNQRVDLSVENIQNDRFTIVLKTWGDTRIARVRASWIAFGSKRSSDDWDVL
ncbi:MAG: H-type lectin domain-containing protein [Halocynthiibacter sp.]